MKNLFLKTSFGFTKFCDDYPTSAIHADSPHVYTSQKILNSSTTNKIHLKCDIIDGSIVNGVRQPVMFSLW